jgi:hypothetical protein
VLVGLPVGLSRLTLISVVTINAIPSPPVLPFFKLTPQFLLKTMEESSTPIPATIRNQ